MDKEFMVLEAISQHLKMIEKQYELAIEQSKNTVTLLGNIAQELTYLNERYEK